MYDIVIWVIDMVEKDVVVLFKWFCLGDFGEGDVKMYVDMVCIISSYIVKGLKGNEKFYVRGCVLIWYFK